MNFLLRNSLSSSDLPLITEQEKENRPSFQIGGSLEMVLSRESIGDDVRSAEGGGGAGGGGVDVGKTRNRVVLEDHTDVPAEEGGILIPCRKLPEKWESSGDMKSLVSLDRSFVFPGEKLHIVVYILSHDPLVPEIITPFRVAAILNKTCLMQQNQAVGESDASSTMLGDSDKGPEVSCGSVALESEGCDSAEVKGLNAYLGKNMPSVTESLLRMEDNKKRSALLLENFRSSHFFLRIAGTDESLQRKQTGSDRLSEEFEKRDHLKDQPEQRMPIPSRGAIPIVMEGGKFDPKMAGGVARNVVACHSLANGDIAVVLQVTIATDVLDDAVLEVLQFEQPQNQRNSSIGVLEKSLSVHSGMIATDLDPSQHLLQWLLPLDHLSSPTLFPSPMSASLVDNISQRLSVAATPSSSLFSFGSFRSSSMGSSQNAQYAVSSALPHSALNYASEEWDRLSTQKRQDERSEGLLSFRGAQLEPQRFSVHSGLAGLYVPGRRWRRKLEVVQPIAIDSYIANCNTEDFICVQIENVVPAHIQGVTMIVDSISMICQSANPSSPPLFVPIACVEVGEDHKLPGLLLRSGEQHSFLLKPTSPTWRSSVTEKDESSHMGLMHVLELSNTNNSKEIDFPAPVFGMKAWEKRACFQQESGSYALVVSCRCSHTEYRFNLKHSVHWQPRAPRDLLLSVALEPATTPVMPTGTLPQLLSQVLTVQATNLTSNDLTLTLLAPSFISSTSTVLSLRANPFISRMNSFRSFREGKKWLAVKEGEINKEEFRSQSRSSLQRSFSLPTARPIESIMGMSPRVVKERAISVAEIAAENKTAHTHLWLQSTVPLGCVPTQSTIAVKCDLLPLTDGIITLDTLHISTKERGRA